MFKNNVLNESKINNNLSIFWNISRYSFNQKNLILGVIEKYSLNYILPFFNSFIRADIKNTEIVMFVRYISQTTIDYLKRIGVFVYKIPESYKNVSIINIRWKMYIDYLKEKKNEYNLVLHTDVGDTFFQRDVFQYYKDYEPFLGVAIEDETLNEKVDKQWVIDFAGEEIHKKIQNERLICVGQIWGTLDKFLQFSIIFWEKLKTYPKAIEQGIGNYLFYYEKIFKDCLIKSDNFGPIMTIGLTKRNNIIFDSEYNILNFRGEIASLVHQYDRKPDIVRIVINKFCPEILNSKINKKIINQTNITDINKNFNHSNPNKIKKEKSKNIITLFIIFYIFTIILIIKIFFINKINYLSNIIFNFIN